MSWARRRPAGVRTRLGILAEAIEGDPEAQRGEIEISQLGVGRLRELEGVDASGRPGQFELIGEVAHEGEVALVLQIRVGDLQIVSRIPEGLVARLEGAVPVGVQRLGDRVDLPLGVYQLDDGRCLIRGDVVEGASLDVAVGVANPSEIDGVR